MALFVDAGNSGTGTGAATSVNCSAVNAVAGNLLVVFTRYETTATTVTISDTAGNTWTEVTPTHVQLGSSGGRITAHYVLNCLGNSSNVITATFGASRSYIRCWVEQFSGLGSFVNSETASATGTSIAGAGLSASTDGLLVAGLGNFNNGTNSIANDLTNNRSYSGTDLYGMDGDYIFTGSGTRTAGFTIDASNNVGLIALLFADSAGGVSLLPRRYGRGIARGIARGI